MADPVADPERRELLHSVGRAGLLLLPMVLGLALGRVAPPAHLASVDFNFVPAIGCALCFDFAVRRLHSGAGERGLPRALGVATGVAWMLAMLFSAFSLARMM